MSGLDEKGRYCICNSKTNPCIVCGKPKFIDPEWLKRKIEEEPDGMEVGAGFEIFNAPASAPVTPADVGELVERLRARLEHTFDYATQGAEWQNDALCQEAATALERVVRERDEALATLEHDRAKVITACNEFSDAFARRKWLLESRGPYEWDDDRYRDEFSAALAELSEPVERMRVIGKDWSNCPTNHDEIMRARQDWKARAESAEAKLAEARKVIEAYEKVMKTNDDVRKAIVEWQGAQR